MQKSLFKNTIYKLTLTVVNIMVPLLIGPYIMRLLDMELYGMYNRIFAEFQIFLTFGAFGIYNYGIREISKVRDNPKKVGQLFTGLFVLSFLSNLIVIGIYIGYTMIVSAGLETYIYLIFIMQLVGNIFYIEFANEAMESYGFITAKSIVIKVFYLLGIFVFVREPDDILIYTVVISMTVFMNNFVSFIIIKRNLKLDTSDMRLVYHIKQLIVLVIISNIDILYSQLDKILLGKYVSDVAVTFYTTPFFLVSTLAAIPLAIINVSIPRLNYLLEVEGKKSYEESMKTIISSLLFVVVPIGFGVAALSTEIIFVYAGEQYMAAGTVLAVAAIVRLVVTLESISTHFIMYPNKKEKMIVRLSLCCGLFNLVMKIVLILVGGLTPLNAYATTGLATLAFFLSQYIYGKKWLGIDVKIMTKQNIRYFILGGSFLVVSWIVHQFQLDLLLNIVVVMPICMVLYGGVLLACKDENLKMIMDKFLGRFKIKR